MESKVIRKNTQEILVKNDIGLGVNYYIETEEGKIKAIEYLSDKFITYVQLIENRKEEIVGKVYDELLTIDWCSNSKLERMSKEEISKTIAKSENLLELIGEIYNEKFFYRCSGKKINTDFADYIDQYDECDEYFNIEPLYSIIYRTERDKFEENMAEAIETYKEEEMDEIIDAGEQEYVCCSERELTERDYYIIINETILEENLESKYKGLLYVSPLVCYLLKNEAIDKIKLAKNLGVEEYIEKDIQEYEEMKKNSISFSFSLDDFNKKALSKSEVDTLRSLLETDRSRNVNVQYKHLSEDEIKKQIDELYK